MGDNKKVKITAKLCCSTLILILPLAVVLGLGIVGIVKANAASEDEFRAHFCDPTTDNGTQEWKYWMIGASAAILPFAIFGTIAIYLLTNAAKQIYKAEAESDSEFIPFEGKKLRNFSKGAVIPVFISLLTISMALLCMLWSIGIAYDNARRPNKNITLYILVDFLVGVLMPLLLIASVVFFFWFLSHIIINTHDESDIDSSYLLTKLLPVKKVKVKDSVYWKIQNNLYFKLNSNLCSRCAGARCQTVTTTVFFAIFASLSFLFAVSYFVDQTVIMQRTLQELPHESEVDTFDCFSINPYIYYRPNEQNVTDLLHNCTQFYEHCEQSCVDIVTNCASAGNCTTQFQECAESCAPCVGGCVKGLQENLRQLSFCNPPVTTFSCPQPSAICLIPGIPVPEPSSDCSDVVDIDVEEEDIGAISTTLNSERLDQCTSLLTNCTALVHNCQTSDRTDCEERLELCLMRLQACRRPTVYFCFQFLKFGRSTNVIEAIAGAFALYLSTLAFFSGSFAVAGILMQFYTTCFLGTGFIIAASFLIIIGLILVIVDPGLEHENIIKLFQYVYGGVFILLIGIMLIFSKLHTKAPKKDTSPSNAGVNESKL